MAAFAADLNELLVEIYRNIEILEESELKKSRLNLSISEMHMIELIAKAVAVILTGAGRKVEAFHARCHRNMIREISDDLTEGEKAELLRTMSRINTYFRTKI